MPKITELTPEQWESMEQYRQRAYRLGSSTEPCDRPRFEQAVTGLYAEIGKVPPKFVWCPGPTLAAILPLLLKDSPKTLRDQLRDQLWDQLRDQLGGQLRDQLGGQLRDQLRDQLGGQLWNQLWNQLWDQLRDQLGGQLRDQLHRCLWGGHELHYWSWYDFAQSIGVIYTEQQARLLKLWIDSCESGHWWWPYEGVVFASERPLACQIDDERRLHCEDGAALAYRDGTEVHAIGGVRLEKWIVTEPDKITTDKIDAESNAEVRRIMTERYGVGRYLVDTGAEVVELDQGGGLGDSNSRALYRDKRGRKWLCGTDGSTGRVYFMQAPEEVNTCRQAHEALSGIDESLIIAES